MTFYQNGLFLPTGFRGLLSCCYGKRNTAPSSPEILPTDQPSSHQLPGVAGDDSFDASDKSAEIQPQQIELYHADNNEDAYEPNTEKMNAPIDQESEATAATAATAAALEVGVRFDLANRQVAVRIQRAVNLSQGDYQLPGACDSVQVCCALLPARRQRHRTGIVPIHSPDFDSVFLLNNVTLSEANSLSVRFRAYGCKRRSRRHVIGECQLPLQSLRHSTTIEESLVLPLMRQRIRKTSDTSESCSSSTVAGSLCSLGVSPQAELLLGAAYNLRTGQLKLEILKASCLPLTAYNKPPDSLVKLQVQATSAGITLHKAKTRSLAGTRDPMWRESFVFSLNKFQLSGIAVRISVCYRRPVVGRRDEIGWVIFGEQGCTESQEHWRDCMEAEGQQVCRWHRLQQ